MVQIDYAKFNEHFYFASLMKQNKINGIGLGII